MERMIEKLCSPLMELVPRALAEEGQKRRVSGDFVFVLRDSGEAEIVEYMGSAGDLEIPDQLEGHAVAAIGDSAFTRCEGLVSVVIPRGVTSIGRQAFFRCTNLTSAILPDSVASIGEEAFEDNDWNMMITVERGSYAEQ